MIATVFLAILGYGVHRSVAATIKTNLRSQLQTLLLVETEMLQNWIKANTANRRAYDVRLRANSRRQF